MLLAVSLALCGCAVLEDVGLVRPTASALEWTAEDAALVSGHLVQALMLAYSQDTLFFLNVSSPLGTAVEAQLRESGYSISEPADDSASKAEGLELTVTAAIVSVEQGAAQLWAGLEVEGWRVDGLFVPGDDGRLGLSGGLTVRDR